MRKVLFVIAGLLLPGIAFGLIFTPPPTDKSLQLLGSIFGSQLGVYLGNTPNLALEHMFQSLNTVMVVIGTIIVSYTGIVSTVNTAQEGKTMGRKFASIWIPARSIMGMILIAPTPGSGYSLIQATVIWLIVNGVGAADRIWTDVLHDLGRGLAVSSSMITPPSTDTAFNNLNRQANDLVANLLQSAVCQHTLNNASNLSKRGFVQRFYQSDNNYSSGTTYIGVANIAGRHELCGSYELKAEVERNEWPIAEQNLINDNELKQKGAELYLHKRMALDSAYELLNPVAEAISREQVRPRGADNRLRPLLADEYLHPAGFIRQARDAYVSNMRKLVKPQLINELRQVVRTGSKNGWIAAGPFYFTLTQQRPQQLFATVLKQPPIIHNVPWCQNAEQCTGDLPGNTNELTPILRESIEDAALRNKLARTLWDAKIYHNLDKRIGIDQKLDLTTGDMDNEERELNAEQQRMVAAITDLLKKPNTDALAAQGQFGAKLMVDTEKPWVEKITEANLRLRMALRDHGSVPPEVLDKVSELISNSSFELNIFAVVWVMGAMLAIYMPLIPYMMFTVGVLGWYLLVIEAVVAAPILALAFTMPSGEELGKILQGMMILLNVILRPTLMLFGFVLATRLYNTIMQYVHFGLSANFDYLHTGESTLAWVAILAIYLGFTLALANKCFALIYALPDKVLRWMGGAPEHSDATAELQQAKGALSKGSEMASKAGVAYGTSNLNQLSGQLTTGRQQAAARAAEFPPNVAPPARQAVAEEVESAEEESVV